ncbi:MAG: FliA/WhiG family RNA polymerase sigma factor [Acidobacteriia bacterium]|nr:FliA/WhiG family RNA polymerase sigma factor [Terriglobia bacterium]
MAAPLITRSERNKLVAAHLPWIRLVVHRMASRLPRWMDSNDLLNTGILGLLDAASRFDVRQKVQFKTYAELRIRGAIFDSLREMDWVPRSLRQKEKKWKKASGELAQKLGREAEEKEMAKALGMKTAEYQVFREEVRQVSFGHFQPAVSNDKDGDEATDLLEFVPAGDQSNPHLICERSEMRRLVAGLIEALPRKERLVLTLYYYEQLSMKEIGSILGVNESRVSQLRQKALFLLRRRMLNSHPPIGTPSSLIASAT